jgi:hypothetical protein
MGIFSWKGRATPEKNWKISNRLADELLSNDIHWLCFPIFGTIQ